jgi:hypothetical protein
MKKVPHKYTRYDGNEFVGGTIAFTIDLNGHSFGVYETLYPNVPVFIQLRYLVQRKHGVLMQDERIKLKERTYG